MHSLAAVAGKFGFWYLKGGRPQRPFPAHRCWPDVANLMSEINVKRNNVNRLRISFKSGHTNERIRMNVYLCKVCLKI